MEEEERRSGAFDGSVQIHGEQEETKPAAGKRFLVTHLSVSDRAVDGATMPKAVQDFHEAMLGAPSEG